MKTKMGITMDANDFRHYLLRYGIRHLNVMAGDLMIRVERSDVIEQVMDRDNVVVTFKHVEKRSLVVEFDVDKSELMGVESCELAACVGE